MSSSRLKERLIEKNSKENTVTATTTKPTMNSVSALFTFDRLNNTFLKDQLRKATEWNLTGKPISYKLQSGELVLPADIADTPDNQLKHVIVMVGNERPVPQQDGTMKHEITGGQQVFMYPNRNGYEARCGCDYSAQTRLDRFTNKEMGNTCVHMMAALYILEPDLMNEQIATWVADEQRSAKANAVLEADIENLTRMPSF